MDPLDLEARFARAREDMVARQIVARGVHDTRVLAALREIPRHRFVPDEYLGEAYQDHPLPIGLGQTISQPYIVAFMAAALELDPTDRVLEVGAGSGYMAAVLGRLAGEVHAVELEEALAARAARLLASLGAIRVHVHAADGHLGWPAAAPFDAIMLSCAAPEIPPALVAQLADGGRMILPLGAPFGIQELLLLRKRGANLEAHPLMSVAFVPLRRP